MLIRSVSVPCSQQWPAGGFTQMVQRGVAEHIVLSLGGEGTVGVTANARFKCDAPEVERQSAVGAGDSMVAAIVLALARGQTFREAVAFGTAAASATVMSPATRLCDRSVTERLKKDIRITDV